MLTIRHHLVAKFSSDARGATWWPNFEPMHMLRFHENSSNHPKNFTFPFFCWQLVFAFQLALISRKKLFECTAMHLATWKPEFSGGHLMPQIESKLLPINKTLPLYGSLNVTQEQFFEGLHFWQMCLSYFKDVIVQIEYSYEISVN